MQKFWFVGAVALVLGVFFLWQKEEVPVEKRQFVVGLQSGYPPYEFVDGEGKIVGFDVDLAQKIADRLGLELVIKDMEFEGEILSLKQGGIDAIISGMNITPSRLKEIYMVPYHGEAVTSFSLLFWGEVPQEIQSLQDIEKFKEGSLSVSSGSVAESFLQKFPQIPVKSLDGAILPLMDVKYGKSTATFVETEVAEFFAKKYPEIVALKIPLSEEDQILGFGIGVSKKNPEMFHKISEIISELKTSGELKTLENRWFEEG